MENILEMFFGWVISKLGYFPYIWCKPLGLWDLSDVVAVLFMGFLLVVAYMTFKEIMESES